MVLKGHSHRVSLKPAGGKEVFRDNSTTRRTCHLLHQGIRPNITELGYRGNTR